MDLLYVNQFNGTVAELIVVYSVEQYVFLSFQTYCSEIL